MIVWPLASALTPAVRCTGPSGGAHRPALALRPRTHHAPHMRALLPPRLIRRRALTSVSIAALLAAGSVGCGDASSPAPPDAPTPDGSVDAAMDTADASPTDAPLPDVTPDVADDVGADVAEDISDVGPDLPETTEEAALRLTLTIPPETPAAGVVRVQVAPADLELDLDCGALTRICSGTVTLARPLSGTLVPTFDRGGEVDHALNLDGTPAAAQAFTVDAGAAQVDVSFEVERWGPESGASAHALAFLVAPPEETPPHEPLHVSGGAPALGAWDGVGVRLVPARDGLHAAVVEIPDLRSVSFKVTRGSWYSVEKGAAGEEIDDRRSDIGGGLRRVNAAPVRWADLLRAGTGTLSGDVRVLASVPSDHLDHARDVLVWLPPGYRADPSARFPVLYMHDGQNVMDASTAFGGVEWGADETLAALVAAGNAPENIVVAVGNSEDRMSEYTPTVDATYGGGGAAGYARFLVEELKPLIDRLYRTRPEAASTGVAGSSLGGLVSMWLGLEHPDVFGRLGVISPSVWWDDRVILDLVAEAPTPAVRPKVWLDIGTAEGSGATAVENTRALRDALLARGWALGADLGYLEVPGAGHNESAWAARLGGILAFLLAD